MKKSVLAFTLLTLSNFAFAELLTVAGGHTTLNIENQMVSQSIQMTTIGRGVREKKFLIVPVRVYSAELMVSDPSSFKRDLKDTVALDSLSTMRGTMKAAALRLTFLRNVSGKQIQDSFTDALNANQIKIEDSVHMAEFLRKVSEVSSAEEGKSVVIAANFATNTLFLQDGRGKTETIHGDEKFIKDVFRIWLGVPADSGLKTLKEALIQGTQS